MIALKFLLGLLAGQKASWALTWHQAQWRQKNAHNFTRAGRRFPFDRVTVGRASYGTLHVHSYSAGQTREGLKIGEFVSIADEVHFLLGGLHQSRTLTPYPIKAILVNRTHDDPIDADSKGPIVVEDEVWIGFGVTVLSGVTIGRGAIVGAGSMVTKSVPPFAIVAGNPAKLVRFRYQNEGDKALLESHRLSDHSESELVARWESLYQPLAHGSPSRTPGKDTK